MKAYTVPNNGRIAGQELLTQELIWPILYINGFAQDGVPFLIFGRRWDIEVKKGDTIEWDQGIALVFTPYKTILDEENLVRL